MHLKSVNMGLSILSDNTVDYILFVIVAWICAQAIDIIGLTYFEYEKYVFFTFSRSLACTFCKIFIGYACPLYKLSCHFLKQNCRVTYSSI